MTRWRQRTGEEKFIALLPESLSTATWTGAAKPSNFAKAIVDTTVQKRWPTPPTERCGAAIEPLIGHAKSDHRVGRDSLAG
jgi:hypothetical protein